MSRARFASAWLSAAVSRARLACAWLSAASNGRASMVKSRSPFLTESPSWNETLVSSPPTWAFTVMVEYASTFPMTSTLIGHVALGHHGDHHRNRSAVAGRPRPPPPAFTLELLQPPRASRERTSGSQQEAVERISNVHGDAAFDAAPAYRIEEGASAGPERLPGKHNYLQVYLDLTGFAGRGSPPRNDRLTPSGLWCR